jgi:hypothetical protein
VPINPSELVSFVADAYGRWYTAEMSESPTMTFRCPECGVTAEVYVPKGGSLGDAKMSSLGAGVVVEADFVNPRKTNVFHGCTQDEKGENTEMQKVGEREP